MPVFVALGGIVALLFLGAVAGRAYERNAWQRRLLARAGLIDSDRERLERLRRPSERVDTDAETMARAIEAIAVEVERIGEGQRYLTRVLATQIPSPGRMTSPLPGVVRSPVPPPRRH